MFILDLKKDEYGQKDYITPTQKKYFKCALDFALKNKISSVKVNRISYYFDFDNLKVKIVTGNHNGYNYNLKKI